MCLGKRVIIVRRVSMSEPTAETPIAVNSSTTPSAPEETVAAPAVPVAVTKESNEVFLGGMIVGVICLLLIVLAGTFGYFGYRLWREAQVERSTPSIQELGEKAMAEPVAETPAPTSIPTPSPAPSETPAPSAADLATLEVKVLNGGAVKGSAGTLVDILKKAGYTKAAFGNTVADHKGTVIYYGATSQGAAETLKVTIAKTYPAVTLEPAKAGDKDATAAAVVVILGK